MLSKLFDAAYSIQRYEPHVLFAFITIVLFTDLFDETSMDYFQHNILVTAGEGGLISLWSNANKTIDKSQKMTTKVEKANRRKSKPY